MKRFAFIIVTFVFLLGPVQRSGAQRLSDPNTIGWFGCFNTIYLNKKVSVWLEAQWRRDEVVMDWQQLFARGGLQYHFTKDISVMGGYAYALSYPFGDYPSGPHPVPEHRIFEQLSWNDGIGRLGMNHRLRLEQRWLGSIDQSQESGEVERWNYVNRVRYQLRATVPVNKKHMEDKTLYLAAFDEIFISFGKRVNQNIFDQNRAGLVLGYQWSKAVRAEAGFINQTQQQGGLKNGSEVFQYNTGLVVNLYLTINKK